MTWGKTHSGDERQDENTRHGEYFWMPIQTRTEMLTTGFRSVLGIKVFGPDLGTIQDVSVQIEKIIERIFRRRVAYSLSVRQAVTSWTSLLTAKLRRATDLPSAM